MTLSLKIKNTNSGTYAARIERNGATVAVLQPLEEETVTMWDGATLTIIEQPAAAVQATPAVEATPLP